MLVFKEREKPEYPGKNISEQRWKPTTNSNRLWRRVQPSNPGHMVGGECSHRLAIPAPPCPSLWTHFNFTFKGEETFHTHRNLVRATAYYLNARDTDTMIVIHSEGRFTTYIQPWQRNTSAPVQCCHVAVFMYSGNDSSGFQHTWRRGEFKKLAVKAPPSSWWLLIRNPEH